MANSRNNLARLTNEYISDKAQRKKEKEQRDKARAEAQRKREERAEFEILYKDYKSFILPQFLETEFLSLENIKSAYTFETRDAIIKKALQQRGELARAALIENNYKIYYKILKDTEKRKAHHEENRPPTAEEYFQEMKRRKRAVWWQTLKVFINILKFVIFAPLVFTCIFWALLPHTNKKRV